MTLHTKMVKFYSDRFCFLNCSFALPLQKRLVYGLLIRNNREIYRNKHFSEKRLIFHIFGQLRFQWYCCKSGIAIFACWPVGSTGGSFKTTLTSSCLDLEYMMSQCKCLVYTRYKEQCNQTNPNVKGIVS